MKTLSQLAKEFWFPLLLALSWAGYNVATRSPADRWDAVAIVNTFAPAFFLASWMTGQIFRVRKQTRVEENFAGLEKRLEFLVKSLENSTDQLLSHITGGDAFPEILITDLDPATNTGIVGFSHHGDYPIYDVRARIVDINKSRTMKTFSFASMSVTDSHLQIGLLTPNSGTMNGPWGPIDPNEQAYNVFFSARNGRTVQELRLKKVSGQWRQATRIMWHGKAEAVYQRVDEDFPRDASGNVEWN